MPTFSEKLVNLLDPATKLELQRYQKETRTSNDREHMRKVVGLYLQHIESAGQDSNLHPRIREKLAQALICDLVLILNKSLKFFGTTAITFDDETVFTEDGIVMDLAGYDGGKVVTCEELVAFIS